LLLLVLPGVRLAADAGEIDRRIGIIGGNFRLAADAGKVYWVGADGGSPMTVKFGSSFCAAAF